MKAKKLILSLAVSLLSGVVARTQSNEIPGDSDYSGFSRFITQRNIFDPNRYAHESRSGRQPKIVHADSAPAFTLVGTMSYNKGRFAFFSGTSDEMKKILPVSGQIEGYVVTEITTTRATLLGVDKKSVTLNIGDQMRNENNGWQFAGQAVASSPSSTGTTDESGPAAPSADLGNNEVLKRLMKLREQENK